MAGAPGLRRPFEPLVFPVRAEHRDEFRALIAQAHSLGLRKLAFLRSDSETGAAHLANIKLISRELGVELVADLSFKSGITDAQLDQLVTQLEQSGAQTVLNHGSSGVYESVIRKARARGIKAAFMVSTRGRPSWPGIWVSSRRAWSFHRLCPVLGAQNGDYPGIPG